VQSLVRAGDQVFAATAARDTQLRATINALPPFMSQLRVTLGTLNTSLGIAKPTLAVIRQAAPLVRPALSELIALSGPALTLLHQTPTLIQLADQALPAIAQFSAAFNQVLGPLLAAAQQVVPVINYIQLYPQDILAAFSNLPALLNGSAPASNGITHYIRSAITLNNESLFGQSERPATNRHNPYISPGELGNVAAGGLQSSDCNNLGSTSLSSILSAGNVPCRLEPKFPWPSNAASNGPSYYPRVTQAQP
jgi:phospholipid/cholesterol/gamma-HCH transport system substrate-binding protein